MRCILLSTHPIHVDETAKARKNKTCRTIVRQKAKKQTCMKLLGRQSKRILRKQASMKILRKEPTYENTCGESIRLQLPSELPYTAAKGHLHHPHHPKLSNKPRMTQSEPQRKPGWHKLAKSGLSGPEFDNV